MTSFMAEVEVVDRVVLAVFIDMMNADIVFINLNVSERDDFTTPVTNGSVDLEKLLEMECLINDTLDTFCLNWVAIKTKLVLEPSNKLLQSPVAVGKIHVTSVSALVGQGPERSPSQLEGQKALAPALSSQLGAFPRHHL